MKKETIKSLVGTTIFSVLFTKKNGEKRKMLCRLNVTKHLKGGQKSYENDDHLTVYDVISKGYRTVNLDTVEEINYRKKCLKLANK